MRLREFLEVHLPPDGPRTRIPTVTSLLLVLRNVLVSREPIYGLGEWAERFASDLLEMNDRQLKYMNDDRVGRSLDKLFQVHIPDLVLDVVRHVIDEFDVSLDELHNDSTTVSFFGAYSDADEEKTKWNRPTLAITWGHSKDHRPDLKQLLYILTIAEDGGIPIYFTAASGNVVDDQTHRATWDLLCELVGHPDFLYVADCKLATSDNMRHIDTHGGRFITILPKTRREDIEFRQRLVQNPGSVSWTNLYERRNNQNEVIDTLTVCADASLSREGYPLYWFHSTRKAELDRAARAGKIDQAIKQLVELRDKLGSPKTRYRQKDKVEKGVNEILEETGTARWVCVEIEERHDARFKQATRGRPGKNTRFVKNVTTRYNLAYQIDTLALAEDNATAGIFPLVTNDPEQTTEQCLRAYKRQPFVEKRFSQFKTDFEVAPIYLKGVHRIQSLLCIYFFVLLVQALLERQLRQAMARDGVTSLPLYPESRDCKAPTTHRIIDVFESVQRHTLKEDGHSIDFVTELTPLQRDILDLLEFPTRNYGRSAAK